MRALHAGLTARRAQERFHERRLLTHQPIDISLELLDPEEGRSLLLQNAMERPLRREQLRGMTGKLFAEARNGIRGHGYPPRIFVSHDIP